MNNKPRNIPFLTSSISNTYIKCKYAFWENYIHNNGFENYRVDEEQGEEIYLTFGKLIHGCIEKFWLGNERTKKFLYKTYEHDIIDSGISDKGYHDLGYQMLDNFFNYLTEYAPPRKALHSELGFNVKIGGVPFHGHIDQVFYRGNGIYEIEDYKTSKWIPTQEEVDENLQLTLYDLVFSNESMKQYWFNGIKPKAIILSLHFLRTGTVIQTERTDYTRVNALNYFRTIYKQMQYMEDKKFYPELNMFCNYCGCSNVCPLYQSILNDEYVEPNESDYQNSVEYNIEMMNNLSNRIKILESEKQYHIDEIDSYFSKHEDDVVTHNGKEYFMAQSGSRYVKTDLAIKILNENGLWNPREFINSLPVGKLEAITKKYPDVWERLNKFAIGFNYYSPKLKSRDCPKLFTKNRK